MQSSGRCFCLTIRCLSCDSSKTRRISTQMAPGSSPCLAMSDYPYVIMQKHNGEPLGMIEVRPNGHRADFGYALARTHWGKGVMPEAICALVEITLAEPSIYRMEATCDVENKASARALDKAG